MANSLVGLERRLFVDLKKNFVHPSREVSEPNQLVGRDDGLLLMRNCFEREGSHPFIWGQRGVGKTSLAHTACAAYANLVTMGPAIACERNSTVKGLFKDIVRRAVAGRQNILNNSNFKFKIAALGISFEGGIDGFNREISVDSVNQASEILEAIFPIDHGSGKKTVIIIDEFDQLENRDTIQFLTNLAKQMSVDEVGVKLVFCGVASDLKLLIGAHESVGRYISAINLNPLSDNYIWEILEKILLQFGLKLHRGQEVRVGQIACGYPTFAHLIVDEILNVAYDKKFDKTIIDQEIFNEAMRKASSGAATHLQSDYESATMKGTDRYVEVLWSVANGMHIRSRQFKDIKSDYQNIMKIRPGRDVLGSEHQIRNHVNALCSVSNGSVLEKLETGWYRFRDPMFRAYVRMMAYNEGVALGDESFPG